MSAVQESARNIRAICAHLAILAGLCLCHTALAQDLEPRRWTHLPVGLNIAGIGYVYTDAEIFFSPVLKITDGSSEIDSLGFSYARAFDWAGKSARLDLLIPYSSGRWDGVVDHAFETVHRDGVGDPRIRLSVNFYGAPALSGSAYADYRAEHTTNTVIGASIAATLPLGRYCDDCLINIGNNRWSLRPQLGVVHTRGPWSFELTGSAFFFTDNDDFIQGLKLEQETLYAMQSHAIYNFKPGLWASISTGYGVGGRVHIDGQPTKFKVDNWIWGASVGFTVGSTQSMMLTWLSGRTQNLVGRNSDNLILAWSIRWTN